MDKRFSILTNRLDKCYFCGSTQDVEKHEIFFGVKNRENSITYGLVVPLCFEHHRGTRGVHGRDGAELNKWLKDRGQKAFITVYPELDFFKIFGKNYEEVER